MLCRASNPLCTTACPCTRLPLPADIVACFGAPRLIYLSCLVALLIVEADSTDADCGTPPATAACRFFFFTYGSGERVGRATFKPRRRGVGREGDRAADENVALRQPRRGRQDLEVNRQMA